MPRGRERDRLSALPLLNRRATRLIAAAYEAPDTWVGEWLPVPSAAQRAECLNRLGRDPMAPDDAPNGGEPSAWARAYKRACYYQLTHHGFFTGFRPQQERIFPGAGQVSMRWECGELGFSKTDPPVAGYPVRIMIVRDPGRARAAIEAKGQYGANQYGPAPRQFGRP